MCLIFGCLQSLIDFIVAGVKQAETANLEDHSIVIRKLINAVNISVKFEEKVRKEHLLM